MSLANKIVIGLGAMLPSSRWKVFLYRLLGFRIGTHVRIRRGALIHANRASLGDGVTLEPGVRIVCDEIVMGDEAKIDSETVVYGAGRFEMARGAYVGPRAWVNCEAPIVLGVNTGVGPRSAIYTHGVWLSYVDGYPRKFEPVILEDHVWVPGDVTILPGVRIGAGSMIGAGSLVNKDIPPNSFAAGFPAKVVSSMDSIRESVDPADVVARAREALDAYLARLEQHSVRVERRGGEPYAMVGPIGFRARAASIWVATDPVDQALAARITAAGIGGDVILVGLAGIPDEVLALLTQRRNLFWFDFPARRCCAAWKGHAYELRRYLASHYGTRFHLVE